MNMNTNLTKVYEQYKGRWVALDQKLKKVITADKNAKKAYDNAVEKGYTKPVMFKVPSKNLPYIGTSFSS